MTLVQVSDTDWVQALEFPTFLCRSMRKKKKVLLGHLLSLDYIQKQNIKGLLCYVFPNPYTNQESYLSALCLNHVARIMLEPHSRLTVQNGMGVLKYMKQRKEELSR